MKVRKIRYHWILLLNPFLFLWNMIFTFHYTRVRPRCDFSILGRPSSELRRRTDFLRQVTSCTFQSGYWLHFGIVADLVATFDWDHTRLIHRPSCLVIRQWAHYNTHCNTLQHTVSPTGPIHRPSCLVIWQWAHCNTHCNTLQHTATHCKPHQTYSSTAFALLVGFLWGGYDW